MVILTSTSDCTHASTAKVYNLAQTESLLVYKSSTSCSLLKSLSTMFSLLFLSIHAWGIHNVSMQVDATLVIDITLRIPGDCTRLQFQTVESKHWKLPCAGQFHIMVRCMVVLLVGLYRLRCQMLDDLITLQAEVPSSPFGNTMSIHNEHLLLLKSFQGPISLTLGSRCKTAMGQSCT